MEHPQPCGWRLQAVTSFTCHPLRAIMSSPAATCTDFDQCEHGQTSRAPTRILALRMQGLHQSLLDTPGHGRCSHGRNGHETLLGYDSSKREWRTAKKKTYPPNLCKCIADAVVTVVQSMWDQAGSEALPEDMLESDSLRQSLMQFYVSWDPYQGEDESWAPDFVSRHRGSKRTDAELDRFRPPCPPSPEPSGAVQDPTAIPRPSGPAEADEEQEYVDAREFLGLSQSSQVMPGAPSDHTAPPSVPPPPVPVPLSADMLQRIERNRQVARERRNARARADRERRQLEVAPWTRDPEFGFGLFDRAM